MENTYETKDIKATNTKTVSEEMQEELEPTTVRKPILVHEPNEDLVIWEARGPKFKFKNNGNIHSYDSKEKAKEGLALFK